MSGNRCFKIGVLGTRGFPGVQGGVETHCEQLYPRLARFGHSITVVNRAPYFPLNSRKKQFDGVTFKYLWCPRNTFLEAFTHTFLGAFYLRIKGCRCVHIHAVGPALMVPLARILCMKVVMTHHGPDYQRAKWGSFARLILRLGEYLGVHFSNRVITIAPYIASDIETRFNKKPVIIPNGVNIPIPAQTARELEKWDIRPGEYVFTACRFVPEKGILELIRAYQAISDPDFKLVIAGDSDHETDYSRKVKDLALETQAIVLTGFTSGLALRELFSHAGMFVLPSYYEGLPIALLEALSYGLPVLASDIDANIQVGLRPGRYFKTGDIGSLTAGMVRTMAQGISEVEKSNQLKEIAARYSWDSIAEHTQAVYMSLTD